MKARIDFARIASAALTSARSLLEQWLPNGKWQGHEYCLGDRQGSEGDSLKINANTGKWADFATGEGGSDLVSLFAAVYSLTQAEAAQELARTLSIPTGANEPVLAQQDGGPKGKRKGQKWMPIVPAPSKTLKFTARHFHYGDAAAIWAYHDEQGRLLGYVCRFAMSDGGKEIMPACWARSEEGTEGWHWISFPKPRPIYGLELIAGKPDCAVLIVEGEKTCDAARRLLPDLLVLTWPGGSKAVKHVNWAPLAGRRVIIWPDADEAGLRAANEIGLLLRGIAVDVQVVAPPPDVVAGWDLADAEAQGWAGAQVREHMISNAAPPKVPPTPPKAAQAAGGNVTIVHDADAWAERLIRKNNGYPEECWQNVLIILEMHPAWAGTLLWDDFAMRVVTRRKPPIFAGAIGTWDENMDLELGLWIAEQCNLVLRDVGAISKGIKQHTARHRFHPVRDYFDRLQHDGVPRLDQFAFRYLDVPKSEYARLTSLFFFPRHGRADLRAGLHHAPGASARGLPIQGEVERARHHWRRLVLGHTVHAGRQGFLYRDPGQDALRDRRARRIQPR